MKGLSVFGRGVPSTKKLTLINEFLEDRQEFSFDDLLVNPGSFMEVVSAFLAVLELVKVGVIDVFQNRLFGDIKIKGSTRAAERDAREQADGFQ